MSSIERYEFRSGSSQKFWEPRVDGTKIVVRFGRIGTDGQTRETSFANAAAAKAALGKLVAEKTGKGYKRASAKAAAAPKSSKRRDAIVALATQLGDKKVLQTATLACDDPKKFLASTKLERFEDWDDDDLDDLPWYVLVDALEAAGRLKEIDWKEAGDEVLAGLERIGGAPAKKALASAHTPALVLDLRFTDEVLSLFGKLLGAAGQALIQLDTSSDSYSLMIVPPRDVLALAKLARSAGGAVVHWTGKDLATYEAERKRKTARDNTKNPWRMLVVERNHKKGLSTEVENVLWDLLHDDDGTFIEQVRAAVDYAPARDRPLIEMSLALNDGDAPKIAKTTRDPALCLSALVNLRSEPRARLGAAAILASRLKVKPDGGKAHLQIGDAMNLWDSAKDVDRGLANLSATERDTLARLADGMIARGRGRLGDALRALKNAGDARSLPTLEAIDVKERARAAAYAKKHPSWSADPWSEGCDMPGALARIRARMRKRS